MNGNLAVRAIAGTLRVLTPGVKIKKENIKVHYDSLGEVDFRELVSAEFEELWPGALLYCRVEYLMEHPNAVLSGVAKRSST